MSLCISNCRPLSLILCQTQDLKVVVRARKTPIYSHVPIFKPPYLKKYLSYTDETFRDYRGVACLCVYTITDHYLFLKVRYRISKLGSQRIIQPTQMISPISKSKAPYLNLHLICLFVLLL